MASPVLPSDFEEVLVLPDDTLRIALVKAFIRFPVLVYRYYKWKYGGTGQFTEEYQNALCAIACPKKT